jgi:heme A synthase
MLSLLIYVLIVLVIFAAVIYVLRTIPLPAPFNTIAYLVLLIIFLIVMLGLLGLVPGWPARPLA